MNIALKDWVLNGSNTMALGIDKIILPDNIIEMIAECRYLSEQSGIEHAFNLYFKSNQIFAGEMITGEKTSVLIDTDFGRTKELEKAAWIGSCHAHPYIWKLSKRAAIGPSSGDAIFYRNSFNKLTLRRGVHFVIANWRLYMFMYKSKPSLYSSELYDYTPQYIIESASDDLTIMRKKSREYNSKWIWNKMLQSKPQQFEATDDKICDYSIDYFQNYCDVLEDVHSKSDPKSYQVERQLNKQYKTGVGRNFGLPIDLPHNRAKLWSEKSLEFTLDYCQQQGIGLAIEDIDPDITSSGRSEDNDRPNINRVSFNNGLSIKAVSI